MYRGGWSFHLTAPPKHAGNPLSTEHRERGLLLHLLSAGTVQYERVSSNCWCVIGVWHEAMRRTYMHNYGTCRSRAPVSVRAVDARFAVEALGRKATGSRESAQTARRSLMKLKSSIEGRSGGRCRQLFAIYGRGIRAFLAHNHCCCATKVLVVFGTRML